MTDLLTHVLAAYVILTVSSWQSDLVDSRHVSIGMVGAILPDLSKLYLVLDPDVVAAALGAPFSWQGLHTIGPVLALTAAGVFLFPGRERKAVTTALVVGASSHFVLDLFIDRADGLAPPYLFPLTWWEPPAGGLYLSSDIWPGLVAVAVACSVWLIDRRE